MKLSFALLALVAPLLSSAVSVETRDTVDFNPVGVTIHPIVPSRAMPSTNAERMRRGLALKAPAHRSTRTLAARHAQTSSTPGSSYSGRVKCSDKSGKFIGYVRNGVNDLGQWGMTTDASQAQHWGFSWSSSIISISITALGGGPDPSIPKIGFVEGANSPSINLGHGSFSYAYMCSVAETSVNSVPSLVANTFSAATKQAKHAETTVWKFDQSSHKFSLSWINSDGGAAETFVVYVAKSNAFAITGDVDSFKQNVDSSAVEVDFFLEDL